VKITLAIVHEQELVGVYISIDRPCEKRQRTHAVRNERVRVRAYIRVRTGTYVPWSVAYFHVLSLHDSQKKKKLPPSMHVRIYRAAHRLFIKAGTYDVTIFNLFDLLFGLYMFNYLVASTALTAHYVKRKKNCIHGGEL
jgi:hypothetical protein